VFHEILFQKLEKARQKEVEELKNEKEFCVSGSNNMKHN